MKKIWLFGLALIFIFAFSTNVFATMPPPPDPISETRQLLNSSMENPSSIHIRTYVSFDPGYGTNYGDLLYSGKSITEGTEISPDQVCIGIVAVENSCFELVKPTDDNPFYKVYYGGGRTSVKIMTVCNMNLELLKEDIEAYGLQDKIDLENCNICGDSQECCAVIITKQDKQLETNYSETCNASKTAEEIDNLIMSSELIRQFGPIFLFSMPVIVLAVLIYLIIKRKKYMSK